VHGLAGENGSGKSTLSSIICGLIRMDSGEMTKDGKAYIPASPGDANKRGVSMVVQELGIVGTISPCANLFLGNTRQFSRFGVIDNRKIERAAKEAFTRWGLTPVPLSGIAENLSIEQRKVLELARALSVDPDILILDEISQVLSHDNRKVLYKFIKKFTSDGKTIIIITHDLEEMADICDTVSVLRDGELIATIQKNEIDVEKIKYLMVGRKIEGEYYRADREESYGEEALLSVEGLTVPGGISGVSFTLHKGEILGVCGLSDAGIHDLGMALFGLVPARSGSVKYVPANRELKDTLDFIDTRGAYLSKDRDSNGLMLDADILSNISVTNSKHLTGRFKFLSPAKLKQITLAAVNKFDIKTAGLYQRIRMLSGGNKQKVNLSRWLIQELNYIILDCPTRGVDVGVKAYIYGLLKELKKKGLGVILITDEIYEALGMADRILVLKDQKASAMLSRNSDFVEDKIVEVML
jgi:ribose transport system ATP-binding protein